MEVGTNLSSLIIDSQRKLYKITKLTLILFTVLLVVCLFMNAKNIGFNFALMGLLFAIFVPLLLFIRRREFDLFEPIYLFSFFYALVYLFTSIFIYNTDSASLFKSLNFNPSDRINIYIINCLSISILLFYLGYWAASKILKQRKVTSLGNHNLIAYYKYIFPLYIISIIFRFYGYSSGFLGSTAAASNVKLPNIPLISIFFFISNIWFVYYTYFALLSFTSKKYFKLFIIFLSVELFFMLISGDRRTILVIVLNYFACLWYIKCSFPWRKVSILFLFLLGVFLPVTTTYGYYLANNLGADLSIQDTIGILFNSFDVFFNKENSDILYDFLFYPIIQSFNGLYNVSIGYTEFCQRDIALGAIGITNYIKMLLPTFMAPDKHEYARNFIDLYGSKALTYRTDYSPLSIFFTTEMLISYGMKAVYIGMFILGFLVNSLYKLLNSGTSSILMRVFYISSISFFSYVMNYSWLMGDVITTLRLLFYFIIVYLIYKFLIVVSKSAKLSS